MIKKHRCYSKNNHCIDCNKLISNDAKRCVSCLVKRNWKLKKYTSRKGRKNSLYKPQGTITKDAYGYLRIKSGYKKWMGLHRYKVEKYIGYKLKKGWIIHHIDRNISNNKLSNLYICINLKIHLSIEILLANKIIKKNTLKSNLKYFKKLEIK